MVAFEGCSRS